MIKMIPSPKIYELSDELLRFPLKIYTEEADFLPGREAFAQSFRKLYGVELARAPGGILLLRDGSLAPGAYVREAGETLAQALIRECREELDVTLAVAGPLMDVTLVYPDITVHLTLLESTVAEGEPRAIEHHDIRWITMEEAFTGVYPFSPADQEFLERLKRV